MRLQLLPTPRSIAKAKAAQAAERRLVERETGCRYVGDELRPPKLTLIPCLCAGCLVTVVGGSEAEALAKIEVHLLTRHGVQAPQEVA